MKVLVTSKSFGKLSRKPIQRLQDAGFEVYGNEKGRLLNEEEMVEAIQGMDAVILGTEVFNRNVIDHADKLKIVSRYGVGLDKIDVEYLKEKGIAYDYCPGVSAFCGAASALNLEYTLPDISQSVIITRMEGRTPVPSKESIQSFAAHQATMVVFLSTGMLEELSRRLIEGGYTADTPAAIVYKATWPEQKTFVCTVGTLAKTAAENNITKTALMIIGDTVAAAHYDRSKLYDPEFTTEFREAVKSKTHHS